MFPHYRSPQEIVLRVGGSIFLLLLLCGSAFSAYVSLPFVGLIVYLLNTLNFITHEIGHPVFSFFGEFMMYAGGTLFQLLVPALLTYIAIRQNTLVGAWFFFFWFGQNFIGISRYMSDARAHELTLFSPAMMTRHIPQEKIRENHDWTYLLSKLHLLEFDILLGWMTYGVGVVLMLFACAGILLKLDERIRCAALTREGPSSQG